MRTLSKDGRVAIVRDVLMDAPVSHLFPHPMNEPNGEGNGWDLCEPADATSWAIEDRDGNVIDAYPTKGLADAEILRLYGEVD